MSEETAIGKKREPLLAAVLSFGFLGLGQIYNGQLKKGCIFIGLWLAVAYATIFVLLFSRHISYLYIYVIMLLMLPLFSAIDAFFTARRKGTVILFWFNHWIVYSLPGIFIYLAVIGIYFIKPHYTEVFRIGSSGMKWTLIRNDCIVTDTRASVIKTPKRGDVVAFKSPDDPSKKWIERVIGLPGEVLAIKDNVVYINGNELEEPYIYLDQTYLGRMEHTENFKEMNIPTGHVFVMGDNRLASLDSRRFGPISIEAVTGKVLYIYLSPDISRIGTRLE